MGKSEEELDDVEKAAVKAKREADEKQARAEEGLPDEASEPPAPAEGSANSATSDAPATATEEASGGASPDAPAAPATE